MIKRRKNASNDALKETPARNSPAELKWTVLAREKTHYMVRMPLSTWLSLPGHPRQRDIERHARKGHWKFLRTAKGPVLSALHSVVAAEFQGKVFMVDGHTRALLWRKKSLPPPKHLYATVYPCDTIEHFNALYSTFDTQTAVESMTDRVTGACRQHGVQLKSGRLKGGMVVAALAIAATGRTQSKEQFDGFEEFDVYEAVGRFKDELIFVDRLDPPQNLFQTGIIAAALIAAAISPIHTAFFSQLALGGGKTKKGLSDPVAIIKSLVESLKKTDTTWGKDTQVEICTRCLAAAMLFAEGEDAPNYWSAELPAPVDLEKYVERARARKSDAMRV